MGKAESTALRKLPSVDEVLRTAVAADAASRFGRSAVVAAVREMLAAAAIEVPSSVTHVAVDFERQSLRHELAAAGFDFAVPTMTAWLGVVPYLTREAFRATVRCAPAVGTPAIFTACASSGRWLSFPKPVCCAAAL